LRRHKSHVHQTYEDLIRDPEIDAIYNPLPNGLHAEWTIRALQAGKHVLCEKPMASNAREAEAMATAARASGLVLSEAFAYRYHPLTSYVKAILERGELGTIKHIEAQFCFLLPLTNNIRFNFELAGGALMDCGCYPVSLIRYMAGSEPTVERAQASLFAPQVDHQMTVTYPLLMGAPLIGMRHARRNCFAHSESRRRAGGCGSSSVSATLVPLADCAGDAANRSERAC
jgi:predicted dehydrogenase